MPSYQVHSRAKKWFRGCRYQTFSLNTYYVYQRPNIQSTQKNANIYSAVLGTLSQCNNTPAKRSSFARDMLDYITKKANLSRFQRYRGKFVFSIVYGVSLMRLMCAPDSFLWDKSMFYMRGIFPCSFAQIDETTSTTSSSSRPNHAIKMRQIFPR